MASWNNRIVGYDNVPPTDLTANPRNWRTHNKRQAAVLRDVLTDVGLVQNSVVNTRTGLVVDGHLRLSLAVQDNQESVPVTYIDVSEEEELLIMSTFDPVGALAGVDDELLKQLVRDLPTPTTDIATMLNDLTKTQMVTVAQLSPPPLVPIAYEDAQPPQPVDKSKNLLGDAMSTTYKEPKPAKQPWEYDDDDEDDAPPAGQPAKLKPTYMPRNGEVWMIDTCHRVYVTDNPDGTKWIDHDWRPIKPNKSPHRMIDLIHRTYMDTQTDAVAHWHIVSCTDQRHMWYQVALRPDRAAMLIALADDMRIASEMM